MKKPATERILRVRANYINYDNYKPIAITKFKAEHV